MLEEWRFLTKQTFSFKDIVVWCDPLKSYGMIDIHTSLNLNDNFGDLISTLFVFLRTGITWLRFLINNGVLDYQLHSDVREYKT